MESPLDFDAVHWGPTRRKSGTGVSPVRRTHGRDARATTCRFMETFLCAARSGDTGEEADTGGVAGPKGR
jgi:hypothetical protein